MEEKEIGVVSHYFGHISVAGVDITSGAVAIGDTLRFRGHTTDFTTVIESMQIEHEMVTEASEGDSIGLKVPDRVREGDKVFKVIGE
jgi:putative protease